MLKRIINFFKNKKNNYNVALFDPDYLSFVLVEFKKNEDDDDDYGFIFKYDERYDVEDVYDFLDSALCSLELYMEFEDIEEVPVRSNLRVIEGKKKKTKNKGDL